jgi:uncharacterized protein YidB (DUF937 family)
MFDQILGLVKENIGNDPKVASAIPADKADAVHNEIASHITSGLASQTASAGGVGGLISMLKNGIGSGSTITNAIEGGLAGTLASKFGLSPAVTGAIAAALPGLLQKFAHKADDPNDNSITHESITDSISNLGKGGLGSLSGLFK